MKKYVSSLLFLILTICFFLPLSANAEENYLIKVGGTGSHSITVTENTTISQITSVLGEAKIKTESVFGGYAYTFYTDNNYSNYLYIETLSDGKIFSYGSLDQTFKTNTVSYGEKRPSSSGTLSGYDMIDDNKNVIAGIFYNRSALLGGDYSKIKEFFQTEFLKDQAKYLKGINQHSIAMFNALALKLGKKTNYTFDQKLYDISMEFTNKGQSFNTFLADLNVEGEIKDFGNSYPTRSYLLNPLFNASDVKKLATDDITKYPYLIFGYDSTSGAAQSVLISNKIYQTLIDKKAASYLVDQEEIYYNQQIMYALSLLDDTMTEKEKTEILAAYSQTISNYSGNPYDQTYKGIFLVKEAVCAGYADVARLLTRYAGMHCEMVTSRLGNHGWNLCYLDGEFSYIDNTKGIMNIHRVKPYGDYDSVSFDSKTDLLAWDPWRHVFSDAVLRDDFIHSLPEGTSDSTAIPAGMVYTDANNYYYQKRIYEKQEFISYIFKKNRKTSAETRLTTVSKAVGILKDQDLIYFVGDDGNFYSIDTSGKNKKKLATPLSNHSFGAVFLDEGYISYTDFDEKKEETKIVHYKEASKWPKLHTYTVTGQNYDLQYLENDTSVVIVKAVGRGNSYPSGEIVLPQTINNKPVIGIGSEAFQAYSYKNLMTGNITLPNSLEYIGDRAFDRAMGIGNITFNSKLKTIGNSAFSSSGLTGTVSIPDTVTYIGTEAFRFADNITSLEIGGSPILKGYAFQNMDGVRGTVTVKEGVEYLGRNSLAANKNIETIILPSSLKQIQDYSLTNNTNLKEVVILSKDIEYMHLGAVDATIYLYGNTKTSQYADAHNIQYVDLNTVKETITLSETSLTKAVNAEDFSLTYSVTPSFLGKEVTWSSSNDQVASVSSSGVIHLKSGGTTTIRVRTSNGSEATCELTVSENNIRYLVLNHTTIKGSIGDQVTLKNFIYPIDTTDDKTLTYTSSNPSVATVDASGNIHMVGNGRTVITVQTKNNVSATCNVVVASRYLEDEIITMNLFDSLNGEKAMPKINDGSRVSDIDWDISNTSVVSYLSGFKILSASGGGFSTLTAKDSMYGNVTWRIFVPEVIELKDGTHVYPGDFNLDGKFTIDDLNQMIELSSRGYVKEDNQAWFDITGDGYFSDKDIRAFGEIVLNNLVEIPESGPEILVMPSSYTIALGDTSEYQLQVKRNSPSSVKDISITWTSSDEDVAIVLSDGSVIATGEGQAIITATTQDGRVSTSVITVEDANYHLNQNSVTLKVNETTDLELLQDKYIRSYQVIKTSSNETVASIEENTIRALKKGNATITYEIPELHLNLDCEVTVEEDLEHQKPIESISITPSTLQLNLGGSKRLVTQILPNDTTDDRSLRFESSNENIVSVDATGLVKANAKGKATITVYTTNGKTSQVEVQVTGDYLKGDVNMDGAVNIKDAMEIMYIITGRKELTEYVSMNGDLTGDGSVNIKDAMEIMYIVTGRK